MPRRPSGTVAMTEVLSSSVIRWDRPGVAVVPGLNTLMRMSRPLRSTIQLRANERTAAFDALYTEREGKPLIDAIEPVRMTEEPLEFIYSGIYCQHVDTPCLRLDLSKDAVEVGEVSVIALEPRGVAANRGDCLIQLDLAATGNKDVRAFLRETLRNAKANAGAAAGDDSDFVCELAGHDDPLLISPASSCLD